MRLIMLYVVVEKFREKRQMIPLFISFNYLNFNKIFAIFELLDVI